MPAETGGGNYVPNEGQNLEEQVRKSWSEWEHQDLRKEMRAYFSDPEKKDLAAADNLATSIVKNHEYFVVNSGKKNNNWNPEYVQETVSAPHLETPEQRKEYFEGVIKGLEWLRELPPQVQQQALKGIDVEFVRDHGTVVRLIPLWEDKSKPLDKQRRVILNFTGFTPGHYSNDRRGAKNEHTVILTIKHPDKSELNKLSEYNLNLMRVLPFSLRNAAHVLNPQVAKDLFDFPTDTWNSSYPQDYPKVNVVNFAHKFAGEVAPLPMKLKDAQDNWRVDGKDFNNTADSDSKRMTGFSEYIAKERRIVPDREQAWRKDFESNVKRLVPVTGAK